MPLPKALQNLEVSEREKLLAINADLLAALKALISLVDKGDYGEIHDRDMGEIPGPSPYQSQEMLNAEKQARAAIAAATK